MPYLGLQRKQLKEAQDSSAHEKLISSGEEIFFLTLKDVYNILLSEKSKLQNRVCIFLREKDIY